MRRWQRLGVWEQVATGLAAQARRQAGRRAPKHLAVDSQSVPTTRTGGREYDAGKKVKGRTRHIVGDSQGSLVAVAVMLAAVSDAQGAYQVVGQALGRYPSVRMVIADRAYGREGLLG